MIYIAKNKKEEKQGLIDEIDSCLIEGKSINLNSEGYARIGWIKLHRLVLEKKLGRAIQDNMVVDHINRNKLDNRRDNLREVTVLVNNLNKEIKPFLNRRYFGSTYLKARGKWQAQIKINGKQTYLGIFQSEEEAQDCYMKKAKELGRI